MFKAEIQTQLIHELDKLLNTISTKNENVISDFKSFRKLYERFLQGTDLTIEWGNLQTLSKDAIHDYSNLEEPAIENIVEILNKLIVVKLNGGLGTSMGCTGSKCVIPVRNDLNFLDLTVQQIYYLNKTYNADVPLVLMNSFITDEETKKELNKYKGCNVRLYTFLQSKYPRINRENLMSIALSLDDSDPKVWYPPGHGDFYEAFGKSSLLEKFIREGREYCFVSNIDNLGATVDINILNFLLHPSKKSHPDFLMELTDKTNLDVKGGTLVQYEGKLRLLEIAQVPKDHLEEFKSLRKFKTFNTNNLWINLQKISTLLKDKKFDMDIIINQKHLDHGLNVIQLERAAGAAIKCFDKAIGINVPRSRFLPVKKNSDLLLIRSNLYNVKNGSFLMNPQREIPRLPIIKLCGNYFSKVKEFFKRFASVPDMLELDYLTVSGDVTFGKGVSLKGDVIIIANHGNRIDIPSGSILENKIVIGNLRILDH